jgi:hypothetical protein
MRRIGIAGLIGLAGIGGLAVQAHRVDEHQFWTISMPLILVAIGTVSLASATVRATVAARGRDDRLRTELREAVLLERSVNDEQAAQSDARQIVLVVHLLGGSPCLRVENVSPQPILDVRLLQLRWHQDATGSWDWVEPPVRTASRAQLIGPGQSHDFTGAWVRERPDGSIVTPGSTDLDAAIDGIVGAIQWTDVRGVSWQRVGRAEPALVS